LQDTTDVHGSLECVPAVVVMPEGESALGASGGPEQPMEGGGSAETGCECGSPKPQRVNRPCASKQRRGASGSYSQIYGGLYPSKPQSQECLLRRPLENLHVAPWVNGTNKPNGRLLKPTEPEWISAEQAAREISNQDEALVGPSQEVAERS
jgi:hypothetical protein